MKRFNYVFTIFLLFITTINTAQPTLVYDDFENIYSNRFLNRLEFNNKYVFTYKDSTNHNIWITDGTTITNLTQSISDNNFGWSQATSSHLYFVEYNDESHIALWKSDGTLGNQQKVLENTLFQNFHVFQDKLLMITREQNMYDLWVLDNDIPVKLMDDISPVFRFIEFNNELYFYSDNDGLVKTDGTAAGTVIVKPYDENDFNDARLYSNSTTIINGELYFRGCDNQRGCELWKTDGTETGTIFLKDLDPTFSQNGSPSSSYSSLMVINNQFYIYGREGILLYDINQNTTTNLLEFEPFGREGDVYIGTSINNIPIFVIETYEKNGRELWTTDGTAAGTRILKEINRSAANGLDSWSSGIVELNGHLYFQANDGIFGSELWRTDGTTEGTELVYDLSPRGASSLLSNLFVIGNTLYFSNRVFGVYEDYPLQLWRFDLSNFTPQRPADYRDDNEWLSSIHGGFYQKLSDFTTDRNHNAYVAIYDDTYFGNGSVFFEQDTIVNRFTNIYDDDYKVTVAKIAEDNTFQWADIIYTNSNDYLQNIVIGADEAENLYVAGLFEEKLLIGDIEVNRNVENFFIAKYAPNGSLLWVRTGQAKHYTKFTQLITNSKGEVFISGIVDELTYQNRTFGSGQNQAFVMKLNQDGDLFWLVTHDSRIRNVKMAFTPFEDIVLMAANSNQVSLHKISKQSDKLWSKSFLINDKTTVNTLAINSFGDIFIAGGYLNHLNLGSNSVSFEAERYQNGYIAKFNSYGEGIYLEADEENISEYMDIKFDSDNNLYALKKNRYETLQYYENWERYATYSTSTIQKKDPNGQLLKEREILRTFLNYGNIELGSNGNIYYADMYSTQLDSFASSVPRSGYIDDLVFILHFSMDDKMETYEPVYTNDNLTISPNPMKNSCLIYAHNDDWQTYRLNIYGSNGQLVRSIEKNEESYLQSLRVSDLPTGVLIFQFDNGTERISRKVLKSE